MKNLLKIMFFFILGILLSILFFDLTSTANISKKILAKNNTNYIKTELILNDTNSLDIGEIDTSTVIINHIFSRIVLNAFIDDAIKNGLDEQEVIKHLKALDVIITRDMSDYNAIDSNEMELLGLTISVLDPDSSGRIRGAILINIKLLDTPDLYAFTLYHELGHWFGLEHCGCSNRIMMDIQTNYDVEMAFRNWDQTIKAFMENIQEHYDHDNNNYGFPDPIK